MLAFHTLDVFTTQRFAGNPLAVVLGADALTPAQMQILAREFNLSETIFVQAPRDPAHTARVRIFFPTAEIPFAGHPTVGCAILLASLAAPEGDFTRALVLEEEAGLVPVTVTRKGLETHAEFTAPVLPELRPGHPSEGLISRALGLAPGDVGLPGHRPAVWQGGPRFLFLPVRDRACLARARPREPAWSELMTSCGVNSGYLYTEGVGADFQARMFSPTHGIPEDPATGSASALFAAQLHAAGLVPPGTRRFALVQGVEMGRPSEIGLTVEADAKGPTRIRIRGAAVRLSEGRITPPEPCEMPKGYWIAHIDVDDPAAYEGYKRAGAAAVAEYGGRYIVRGGPQEAAEGAARARTVIVEFPSYEAALACYHGPAYQAAAALRQAAARSEFLIVSGPEG